MTVMKTYDPRRSNDAELFPGILKKWTLGYLMTTEPTPTSRAAEPRLGRDRQHLLLARPQPEGHPG